MYSFVVRWVPGKTHFIADALSRAPLFAPEELPDLDIDTAISCLAVTSQPSLSMVYAAIDDDYRTLLCDVKNNTSLSNYSRALKGNFDNLSISDGLVLLDSHRIVLPLPAIKPILKLLHASHSGMTKTLFWHAFCIFGQGCPTTLSNLSLLAPPASKCFPLNLPIPWLPLPPHLILVFRCNTLDWTCSRTPTKTSVLTIGVGYPLYHQLRSLTSESVLRVLTNWFNLFGWPSSIRSDGGPQFRGEFSRFCSSHSIVHQVSAPYNPKSNGLAEAGVKSVKNILRKCSTSGSDAEHMLYETLSEVSVCC